MNQIIDFVFLHYTVSFCAVVSAAFLISYLVRRHRVNFIKFATVIASSAGVIVCMEMALVLFRGNLSDLCTMFELQEAKVAFAIGILVLFWISLNEIIENFRRVYS